MTEKNYSLEELKLAYQELLYEKEEQAKEILLLKERIKQLLNDRYNPKTEKIKNGENPNPEDPSLFDEAVVTEEEKKEIEAEENLIEVPAHQRKKPGRKPLPKYLPREQVLHDLPNHEKVCACGHELNRIGEEISEKLEFSPAVLKVLQHVRPKYACKSCEEGVKIAPVPVVILPKSIATPGLLAHVLACKFEDHLPLYRQEQIWQRLGVELPRATLCNWVLKCGELLVPLVELLKEELLKRDYVHADETTVQVLKEDGKTATSKSYMWVYLTGGADKPILIYEYAPGRGGIFPTIFLEKFKGYLQTDAYGGYNSLRAREDIKVLGCMAHVRRKFVEIVKRSNNKGKAHVAVTYISKLYAVEKQARETNLTPDKIFELRQEKSKPILEKFKVFLDELVPKVPPKSVFGLAITYALNAWPSINIYLEDGRLNIDNNPVENKIRPFALGRRNWLFMGNMRGANSAATIFSLIESAKANGLEGYYYLRHILTKLPFCQTKDDLRGLLPHYCSPSDINKL